MHTTTYTHYKYADRVRASRVVCAASAAMAPPQILALMFLRLKSLHAEHPVALGIDSVSAKRRTWPRVHRTFLQIAEECGRGGMYVKRFPGSMRHEVRSGVRLFTYAAARRASLAHVVCMSSLVASIVVLDWVSS